MNTQALRRELAVMAQRDTREIPFTDRFSFVSSFVARRTETVQSISMPVAGLLIVVEGLKTIIWAGRTYRYRPGEAFALPEGAYVDVINEPDAASGMYRAVFLGFSSSLLEEARRRWSSLAAANASRDPSVAMTPSLCSAVLHTVEALSGQGAASAMVIDHRLSEVLLILAEAGAAPLRPDVRTCSITDAVRAVLRNDLARAWEVADVARELGTSDPTLRRNLRGEGNSFRRILTEERMRNARLLLTEGHATVAEAALSGGYASRSHFAKQFRLIHGHAPSDLSGRPDRDTPGALDASPSAENENWPPRRKV
jgi:AraC-like DNA-binding protein